MLILIILTGVIAGQRMNISQTYATNYAVEMKLNALIGGLRYSDIATIQQLIRYYGRTLPTVLCRPDSYIVDDSILTNFHLVGPFRLRQIRTLETSCTSSEGNLKDFGYVCYSQSCSDSNKDTNDILTGEVPWKYYRTASELGSETITYGELTSYDGSGYAMDFYSNSTLNTFRRAHESMLAHGWIATATRVIFLTLTLYDPNTDQWVYLKTYTEIGVNGAVLPTRITPFIFRPNVFETSTDKSIAAMDIIRLILSFYFLIITFRETASKRSGSWRFNWSYFKEPMFWRDLLTFALVIVGFALSNALDLDTGETLRKNEFVDMEELALKYWLSIQFNILAMMLLFIRLIGVLNVFHSPRVVITTMSQTFYSMVFYLLLLAPMIIGLSVASINIWGNYLEAFHTMEYAFTTNMLLSLGMIDVLEMYMLNSVWTLVFFFVSLFVWSFYLIAIFKGVYLDSRMATRISLGYGEKFTGSKIAAFGWWFIGFLPRRVLAASRDWLQERKEKKKTERAQAAEDTNRQKEGPEESTSRQLT